MRAKFSAGRVVDDGQRFSGWNSGFRPARTDGYTPASVGYAASLARRREIKPL
jgi:hypothetical protein